MYGGVVFADEPIPDHLFINGSPSTTDLPVKTWVRGNGQDSRVFSVCLANSTNNSAVFSGALINLSLNQSDYGSLNFLSGLTTTDGYFNTTFTTKKISGSVNITATATVIVNNTTHVLTNSTVQLIDHDIPYKLSVYQVPETVNIGNVAPINLFYSDRWGNAIDSRYEDATNNTSESVQMSIVSSPSGPPGSENGAVFMPTGQVVTNSYVNSTGGVQSLLQVDHIRGWNIIKVKFNNPPIGSLLNEEKYFFIEGISKTPYHLTLQSIVPPAIPPNLPRQYADGQSVFDLVFLLTDEYGNGVSGGGINITTSLGSSEDTLVFTSKDGYAYVSYGPKSTIGTIDINATAVDNTSVKVSFTVQFVSQEATDMVLTANPQNMPSADVIGSTPAQILAKVIDENGNPVQNETVDFLIQGVTRNTPANPVVSISKTREITDSDGFATIYLTPDTFPVKGKTNYNPTAVGSCNIQAKWQNVTRGLSVTRMIPLTWRNYAYVSVGTSLSNKTVNVTDTVDVTLTLTGDGYALQPNPIDVILCTDRSGSMVYDNPDRMISIREAAKLFVDKMNASRDRVGLVSFGRKGTITYPGDKSNLESDVNNVSLYALPKTYSDYATSDSEITTSTFSSVKTELDKIVPDYGTPMRGGLKLAIDKLKASGRSNAAKAIVLLSDGDYNWYGDPLARYSERGKTTWYPTDFSDLSSYWYKFNGLTDSNQNLSAYAKSNNITIFSIAYGSEISGGGKATLEGLAVSSGGNYWTADAANIEGVYTAIAGKLHEEAGVNTTTDLVYDTIMVDGNTVSVNDTFKGFEYEAQSGISTMVHSWNQTVDIIPSYWTDQSSEWNTSRHLTFSPGTIKIHQVWEAKYRLRVVSEGNINIFGPGSKITFTDLNGVVTSMDIPYTFVTAIGNFTTTGVNQSILNATNITSDEGDPWITWTWDRYYTGIYPVTEYYQISNDNGMQWTQIGMLIIPPDEYKANPKGRFSYLRRLLPPGNVIFRVIVESPDSPPPTPAPTITQVVTEVPTPVGTGVIKFF